jgi:predicted enzyme related to lactoylglutathione lyase
MITNLRFAIALLTVICIASVIGTVLKQNDVISEVCICEGIIGIHGGGEGNRTWTGLSFQVADVIAGAQEIVAAGGQLTREPQPENDEPPHLAMCMDTEGNELMLFRKRH